MDSGASRSFVTDQIQTQPPMKFVGTYSLFELANGETIVSIGIAARVLLYIRTAQCCLDLTAVPLMEGIQVILGLDWLDLINPLVDWKSNSLVIRSGDKLEVVEGIKVNKATQCKIINRDLHGLQHYFVSPKDKSATQPSLH